MLRADGNSPKSLTAFALSFLRQQSRAAEGTALTPGKRCRFNEVLQAPAKGPKGPLQSGCNYPTPAPNRATARRKSSCLLFVQNSRAPCLTNERRIFER